MLLLAAAVWNILAFFEAGAVELSTRIICSKIIYLGAVSTGVFWLAFTLDYSGSAWWKRPGNIILLSIIPLVTLAIAWTNELHGWLWSRIYITNGPLGITSVWEHGPWFMVNPVYQYLLYILGMVILFRYGFRQPRIHFKPVIICLAGTALPIIGSILYVAGINPAGGFDITPFYISVASTIYCLTIFRYRFIDIVPEAYQLMGKNIPDGVLILDSESQIIEVNPAVERIIRKNKASIRGNHLAAVWPELNKIISASDELYHTEILSPDANSPLYLDISAGILRDDHNNIAGKLVILRDITERNTAQKALKESEVKYRGLVNNIKLGIFRSTPEGKGKFLEFNKALEDVTGYSTDELREMQVVHLYLNPEDRKPLIDRIISTMEKTTGRAIIQEER